MVWAQGVYTFSFVDCIAVPGSEATTKNANVSVAYTTATKKKIYKFSIHRAE